MNNSTQARVPQVSLLRPGFIRAKLETFCLRARLQPSHNSSKGKGALAPEVLFSAGPRSHITNREAGLTLVELIITVAILSILATAAVPIARFQARREKERELRRDLWELRAAIDRYKDAADKGAFQVKADSLGYPPDLQTLVDGVDVQGKKVRFLRRIPVDPMTGTNEWGLRSNQDDPDSDSFGGQNVFDVHSKSQGTALDGTKYSTW
ncbi:type II secretion system protein [Edaphobacter aggregans]|uniref:type II secretion system protein n=1 Tax=Edaphobacter aggregans TaxID=570835 RepID=UPI00316ACC8F